MKLSIVIPLFNQAHHLVRCLRSLERQTRLPDEVLVVNDGSLDHPKEVFTAQRFTLPIQWIDLQENSGAPIARNTGFAQSTGDMVMFLDADGELRQDGLALLEQALQKHPEAAFSYPAFRFGGKIFRPGPFDSAALAQRNRIHTSALIRRSAFPGFDPTLTKFQDWDLWLQIIDRGGVGVYVPELLLSFEERRTGGMSRWIPAFAYRLPWKIFGEPPATIQSYEAADRVIRAKHAALLERLATTQEPLLFATKWLHAGIFGLLMLSAAVLGTGAEAAFVLALGIGMMLLATRQPVLALGVLALELMLGSKGGWLKIGADAVHDGGVGIRIVWFVAFFVGWFAWSIRHRAVPHTVRCGAWTRFREIGSSLFWVLPLAVAVTLGVSRGWLLEQPFLFADANAWLFWVMALPVATLLPELSSKRAQGFFAKLVDVGVLWLAGITLALFFLFSRSLPAWVMEPVYLWVRQSGVGEITRAGGSIFRIFLQSQIVLLPYWLWLAVRAVRESLSPDWRFWARWTLVSSALLVSFSRSFWMGMAVGAMSVALLAFVGESSRGRMVWRVARRGTVLMGLTLVLLGGLVWTPLWRGTPDVAQTLESRFGSGEAAVSSRWSLLPVMQEGIARHPWIGSGFGATLTYTSQDPRIVQKTGGEYTTYAFEWGWHDLWYKLGLIGVLAMVWTLGSIGRLGVRLERSERWWTWSTLAALATVHVFTPYLNHPLGIGVLILVWVAAKGSRARC